MPIIFYQIDRDLSMNFSKLDIFFDGLKHNVNKQESEVLMEGTDYKGLSEKLVCLFIAVAAIWLIFEYALGILLPFLLAFCLGVPINKLSVKIHKRIGAPKKLCAAFLVILSFFLLGSIVYLGSARLLSELEDYVGSAQGIGDVFTSALERVGKKIPVLREAIKMLEDGAPNSFSEISVEMARKGIETIGRFAMETLRKAPRIIIASVIALVSCFYFAVDYEKIKSGIYAILPDSAAKCTGRWSELALGALKSYAKAYLAIMLITFGEVFLGLMLIGVRYSFVIALVVAVIDILPIFGTGVVLVPWAAVSLLIGDYRLGTSLLVLYGVITIVRQLVEPRIVGKSLGLHPLVTLFSMFAGLSLFGFFGMLIAPFALLVIKELLNNKSRC
jgi:sporulation integral membrane protein YtvI